MLDRTIPFYNTILKCTSWCSEDIQLPERFIIAEYLPEYEKAWADMEFFAGDFASRNEAEKYFIETYVKDAVQPSERIRFLLNEKGEPVGSCIAWRDKRKELWVPSLHWLIVDERYQRKGLGRALCRDVMNLFHTNGEMPVYLHTQPWSWKALLLYLSLGFRLQKTDTFANYINQYEESMAVLKPILAGEQYRLLLEQSEP